jgi:hypothetical protein
MISRSCLFILSGLLTACTSTALEESERARTDLIGFKKSDLMQCAGVPDKTGQDETGREYLSYSSESTVTVPGPYPNPGFYPGFMYYGNRASMHYHMNYFAGLNDRQETRRCTALFALEDNEVTSLSYSFNDSDGRATGQCYQIVKNCLPPEPR